MRHVSGQFFGNLEIFLEVSCLRAALGGDLEYFQIKACLRAVLSTETQYYQCRTTDSVLEAEITSISLRDLEPTKLKMPNLPASHTKPSHGYHPANPKKAGS